MKRPSKKKLENLKKWLSEFNTEQADAWVEAAKKMAEIKRRGLKLNKKTGRVELSDRDDNE